MVARVVALMCVLLVFSTSALAQSYYLDAVPPANWRPAGPGTDGYALIILTDGASGEEGGQLYIGPEDAVYSPVAKIYHDPYLDTLWQLMPGREAQAALPLAVGGVVVRTIIPVAGRPLIARGMLRFAANAPRYAAQQGFRGAGGVAGRALWKNMILTAGLNWLWDELLQQWVKPQDDAVVSTGLEYTAMQINEVWSPTVQAACEAWVALNAPPGSNGYNATVHSVNGSVCRIRYVSVNDPQSIIWQDVGTRSRGSSCPVGWYWTPAGCLASVNNRPLTIDEFESGLAGQPWPKDLPRHLPDGVPVQDPVINPRPGPWSPPAPIYEPVGDPIKNPDFDPSQAPSPSNPPYKQPGREVQGSPGPGSPWRVTVRPVDKPLEGPQPGQNLDPNAPPDPTKGPDDQPEPRPENKPSDQVPLLCEVFPNISACAELGKPEQAEKLQDDKVNVSIDPDGGFGPDNAACPADRSFGSGGWTFSYAQVCTFATGVRPIVIAFAWLAAGLMVVGVARKQS